MTEKQNAETLELADKLVTIFDRIGVSCDWRLSSEERQDIAKAAVALHALRAPAPSPHPRGEPVADRTERAKKLVEEAWRLTCLGPGEFNDYIVPLIAAALAAPQPAGADAVTDEMLAISGLNHDWNVAMERAGVAEDALQKIADGYGPQHGSKYCRDIALAAFPTPVPQPQPQGDQT